MVDDELKTITEKVKRGALHASWVTVTLNEVLQERPHWGKIIEPVCHFFT